MLIGKGSGGSANRHQKGVYKVSIGGAHGYGKRGSANRHKGCLSGVNNGCSASSRGVNHIVYYLSGCYPKSTLTWFKVSQCE